MKRKIIFILLLSLFTTFSNYVNAQQDTSLYCKANFYSYPDSGNNRLYHFYDASYSGNSPVASWAWTFEDGTTVSEQNPSHLFGPQTNVATVCLAITTYAGCSSVFCNTIYLTDTIFPPQNCWAKFIYQRIDSIVIIPEYIPIQFTDLSVTNSNITSWQWNFGDGTTSTEQNPQHAYYFMVNTYNACLTITTADGCSSTACFDVNLGQPECPVHFFATNNPNSSTSYTFQDDYAPDDITKWFWDFGDGTSSTDAVPTHQFANQGLYTVCLTTSRPQGVCTYCNSVMVGDSIYPPFDCSAGFFYYQHDSTASDRLYFDFVDVSFGNVVAWQWDFGDGTVSNDKNPTHGFWGTQNVYNVCLTITTAEGCSSQFCLPIFVYSNPNTCKAGFYYYKNDSIETFIEGYPISFVDISYGNEQSWYWDFGDGTISTEQNPMHIFNDLGASGSGYNVCLTINTTDGCVSTFCQFVFLSDTIITPSNCYASFYYKVNEQVVCDSAQVPYVFYNTSENVKSWVWAFSDGTITSEETPTHIFALSNIPQMACLMIVTNDGCITSTNQYLYFNIDSVVYNDSLNVWELGQNSGIDKMQNIKILKVFPNPVDKVLHLQIRLNRTSDFDVEIVNLMGQIVYNQHETKSNGTQTVNIPVADLNGGFYIAKIKLANGESVQCKFLK